MRLVAVLADPALADHGGRTRVRVEMAADIIGCEEVTIVNLFPIASQSSLGIAALGDTPSPWIEARSKIRELLVPVPVPVTGQALADDGAGEHLQGGEQRRGAVSLVVIVAAAFGN